MLKKKDKYVVAVVGANGAVGNDIDGAFATHVLVPAAPLASPLLAMNMAATLFRLTPEEALAGMTRNAARALGLDAEVGTIEVGKRAELAVWDVEEPAELVYRIGFNALVEMVG